MKADANSTEGHPKREAYQSDKNLKASIEDPHSSFGAGRVAYDRGRDDSPVDP